MLGFSVVLDTCTIYPAYLRDALLRLAAAETYRPLWSAHILDELRRLLTNRIDVASANRIIDAMTRHFPDALVTGYTRPAMDLHDLASALSKTDCPEAAEESVDTSTARDRGSRHPANQPRASLPWTPTPCAVQAPDSLIVNTVDELRVNLSDEAQP